MITHELLTFFVISAAFMFFFNLYVEIRTVASIFLSAIIAVTVCFFIFPDSIVVEVLIMFVIIISVFYSVSRAVRDKRDDNKMSHNVF